MQDRSTRQKIVSIRSQMVHVSIIDVPIQIGFKKNSRILMLRHRTLISRGAICSRFISNSLFKNDDRINPYRSLIVSERLVTDVVPPDVLYQSEMPP